MIFANRLAHLRFHLDWLHRALADLQVAALIACLQLAVQPEFHAHPAGYVPACVLRALRDSGVLTLPEYKKLVRQFGQ